MRVLIALLFIPLLLAGCDDAFIQETAPGYHPPPPGYGDYGMSERELVRRCRYEVEDRVERRLGRHAEITFQDHRLRRRGRDEVRISGRARVRKGERRYRIDWRCDLDRYDGTVLHSELEWHSGGSAGTDVGGERNRRALHMCSQRLEEKLRRDLGRYVSLEIREPHIYKPSRKRRHVTGEAVARVQNGQGRISLDCRVAFEPPRVESASYRWIRRPPRGKHQKRARDLCKAALKRRLHLQGFGKIEFLKVDARALSEEVKRVSMKTRLHRHGNAAVRRYHCRVNVPRQRVLEIAPGG